MAREGLDLVFCLNPTSTRERSGGPGIGDRMARTLRAASGRRLGHEAKRVRAGGAEVLLIQPLADDLAVMGRNRMSGRRRNEVIETAQRTVAEQLSAPSLTDLLAELPEGEPHKVGMPDGPAAKWPRLGPARLGRAA